MSGRPISVSLTFDIHWQAPDHKTGWSRGCTSHLTSCPRLTYLHWRAQVWAVKTFMKLCLLEQPQHYSDKSLRSIIHIRAHTALSITTQNTVRSQEWNSAKWIPLSPDRMKLSHDVGLRTHSFKVMIWKRNPCCHETRDLVANRFYWCCWPVMEDTQSGESWYILHHFDTDSITAEMAAGGHCMQCTHKMSGKSMFCVLTALTPDSSYYGSGHVTQCSVGRIGSYQGIFGYLQDRTFHKCQTLSAVSQRNSSKIFLHIWLF